MKTAIKLVLIYLAIQVVASFVIGIPVMIYNLIQGNDINAMSNGMVAIVMFLSFVLMGIYLWKSGYISLDEKTWSSVSTGYLLTSVLICLALIVIVEYILMNMPWLPDILEATFGSMQSTWLGILCIAVFGPVLEELMFRGAITTALLKKHSPAKAIILSALVFGIIHINPVQVVGATFIGLVLAWMFYKTASLIPCILIHIIYNSISVYLGLRFSEAKYLRDLFSGLVYDVVLIASIVIFVVSILWMKRATIASSWKDNVQDEVKNFNSRN